MGHAGFCPSGSCRILSISRSLGFGVEVSGLGPEDGFLCMDVSCPVTVQVLVGRILLLGDLWFGLGVHVPE